MTNEDIEFLNAEFAEYERYMAFEEYCRANDEEEIERQQAEEWEMRHY